jgi:hypothetical protein
VLPELRIASPCTADWNRMEGDERVRYCAECKLNVYDFSALSTREIQQLLHGTVGRLCGRLYKRQDGTLLTKDCPVGFRKKVRRISRVAAAAFPALAVWMGTASAQQPRPSTSSSTSLVQIDPFDTGLVVEVSDSSDVLLQFAKVLILCENDELLADGLTDSRGRFVVSGLAQGSYVVKVASVGFETAVLRKIPFPRPQILQVKMHAMGKPTATSNRNPIHLPSAATMGWVVASPALADSERPLRFTERI